MALPPAESAEALTNLWEEAEPQRGGARGHLLSQVWKDHAAHSAWGSGFRGGALGTRPLVTTPSPRPKAGPGCGGREQRGGGGGGGEESQVRVGEGKKRQQETRAQPDTYSGTTCLICGFTYPSTALAAEWGRW